MPIKRIRYEQYLLNSNKQETRTSKQKVFIEITRIQRVCKIFCDEMCLNIWVECSSSNPPLNKYPIADVTVPSVPLFFINFIFFAKSFTLFISYLRNHSYDCEDNKFYAHVITKFHHGYQPYSFRGNFS